MWFLPQLSHGSLDEATAKPNHSAGAGSDTRPHVIIETMFHTLEKRIDDSVESSPESGIRQTQFAHFSMGDLPNHLPQTDMDPTTDETRFFVNKERSNPQPPCIHLATPACCDDMSARILVRCRHVPVEGSLYAGGLGRMYLKLRLGELHERHGDAAAARRLWQTALDDLPSSLPNSHRVSLLESPVVGCLALQAVLEYRLGCEEAREAVDALINWLDTATRALPASECDVLYGRAGALQALLMLRVELGDAHIGQQLAMRLAQEIIDEGRSFAGKHVECRLPLLWQWHETRYLGAAHGVVGILHTLLGLSKEDRQRLAVENELQSTIEDLDQYCWPSGNLDSSIKAHDTDRLVHWCHGAPGYVLLLTKAAEIYGNGVYLEQAKAIANNVIWPRGLLRKGVGLCHGISGNAFALLRLARHDESFLHKACYFADFAVENLEQLALIPDHPWSLYQGMGGLCALIIALACPEEAQFPLYY